MAKRKKHQELPKPEDIPRRMEFFKKIDPLIEEKSRKSICKGCENCMGFNGEFYDCKIANEDPLKVDVRYRHEGHFWMEIFACKQFEKKKPVSAKVIKEYLEELFYDASLEFEKTIDNDPEIIDGMQVMCNKIVEKFEVYRRND